MKKILSIACSCFLALTAVFAAGCNKDTGNGGGDEPPADTPPEPPVFSEEMRELAFDTPKAQKWADIADPDATKGEAIVSIGMLEDMGKDDYSGCYLLSGIKTATIDIDAKSAKYKVHFFDRGSILGYPVVNQYFQDVLDLIFYETEFIDAGEDFSDIHETMMYYLETEDGYRYVCSDGYLRDEYSVDGVKKCKRTDKKVNVPYLATVAFFSMASENWNGNTNIDYSLKEYYTGIYSRSRSEYSVKLVKGAKEITVDGADFDAAWSDATVYKCKYTVNEEHKEKNGEYIEAIFTNDLGARNYIITPNGDMHEQEIYTTIFYHTAYPCMGLYADMTQVFCDNVDYSVVSAFFDEAA